LRKAVVRRHFVVAARETVFVWRNEQSDAFCVFGDMASETPPLFFGHNV
jgi:hypothetical protein